MTRHIKKIFKAFMSEYNLTTQELLMVISLGIVAGMMIVSSLMQLTK